uniref:Uncharacterized protein n=1 Tax=Arion vulgaris TaxID=1028688 RepID=A0A0B7BF12_9EUPU
MSAKKVLASAAVKKRRPAVAIKKIGVSACLSLGTSSLARDTILVRYIDRPS